MAAEKSSTSRLKENLLVQADKMEDQCESCEKKMDKSKLLKHIGNTRSCKAYYGERLEELKREKEIERKRRNRKNMSEAKKQEINEKRREKRKKEDEDMEERYLSFASQGLNCKGEEEEPKDEEKVSKYSEKCGFCNAIFDIEAIFETYRQQQILQIVLWTKI